MEDTAHVRGGAISAIISAIAAKSCCWLTPVLSLSSIAMSRPLFGSMTLNHLVLSFACVLLAWSVWRLARGLYAMRKHNQRAVREGSKPITPNYWRIGFKVALIVFALYSVTMGVHEALYSSHISHDQHHGHTHH